MVSCERNRKSIVDIMTRAGFILKEDKTSEKPAQSVKFLGLINNFEQFVYEMPETKKVKYRNLLQSTITKQCCSLKELAELNGKLSHMSLAAGPILLLLTRELNATIADYANSDGWTRNPQITLSARILLDLQRILDRWSKLDSYPIYGEERFSPAVIIYHDASDSGYCLQVKFKGSIRYEEPFPASFRMPLLEEDKPRSSSYREALALRNFLQCCGPRLKGQKIQTYSDSKVLEQALIKGSKVREILSLMLDIFDIITEQKIILKTSWVPRTLAPLKKVDSLSRFTIQEQRSFDRDNWGVSDLDLQTIFSYFEDEISKDSRDWLDLFADKRSARFEKFFSPIEEPSALGIDAFNHSWKHNLCFAYPPVRLIPAAIRHAIDCKATGVLILPKWVSRSFWNLICEDGVHINSMFSSGMLEYYPTIENFGTVKSPLFKGKSSFPWLILWFKPVNKPLISKVSEINCTKFGCNKCKL